MSELEELLERAESENQRLRDEVLQLRGTARHQAEIIEGYVNQGIARKQECRQTADADAELFRMIREKPDLSEGALHVVIGGKAETEYVNEEYDEEIDDMPGAISEERNKALEAIMLVTAIMMLIVIIAIWWRVIL